MVGRSLVIGQTNPRVIAHIRDAIETNSHIPFRQMLTMDSKAWNANVKAGKARLQYEQAWSMIHFLVFGEGGRHDGEFFDYLRYLNAGFDSYTSFVRAFGSDDIEQFEEDWKRHALAQQPSAFITAMERIEFLAAGLLELSKSRVYPQTIEELRTRLREIEFTYTLNSHNIQTELSAMDDALFTIPQDDLVREGRDRAVRAGEDQGAAAQHAPAPLGARISHAAHRAIGCASAEQCRGAVDPQRGHRGVRV